MLQLCTELQHTCNVTTVTGTGQTDRETQMRNLKNSLLKGWGKWEKVKGSGEQVIIHQRSVETPRQAARSRQPAGWRIWENQGRTRGETRGR